MNILKTRKVYGVTPLAFGALLVILHILLGYVISTAALLSSEALRIVIFNINAALSIFGLLILATYFLLKEKASLLPSSSELLLSIFFAMFLCLFLFAWSELPAQGWDSLDSWLVHASNIAALVEDQDGSAYFYEQRHPLTISAMMALPGLLNAANGNSAASIWLGVIPYVSMALVCFGYSRFLGVDNKIQVITIYMLLSVPLITNHTLLFGYADIWLASALVATVALSGLFLRTKDWQTLGLALTGLLAMVAVKNIGTIFAIAILFVGGIVFFRSKISKKLVSYAAMIAVMTLGLLVESGAPQVKSVFSVSLNEDSVIFFREDCTKAAFREKFLLDIHPVNPKNLSASQWVQERYPGRDFKIFKTNFDEVEKMGSTCKFSISIDGYKPKRIRVGQLSELNHPSWIRILLPDANYFEIPMLDVSIQIGRSVVVEASGRSMVLDPTSPTEVLRTAHVALIENGSYSIFFLALTLLTLFSIREGKRLFSPQLFAMTAAWSLIILLLAAQLFIKDFYNTSLPNTDTRFSRFMLWLPALVCLALYESGVSRSQSLPLNVTEKSKSA
ncbi:MAG: hypothetical protein V7696_00250 [Halioglobus sp.]